MATKSNLVTQPRRRFAPRDLAALNRAQRRKLAQVLLTEGGGRIVEYNHPASYDEFVMEVVPLWNVRRIRARVLTSAADQKAVDRLAERIAEADDAEGLLLDPFDGPSAKLSLPANVRLLTAAEMIARLERSALVAWQEHRPSPSYNRVATQRTLDKDAAFLDPVGLRWLPTLALNELPLDLKDGDLPPQDALERVAFRLLTSVFRLGGERYGESRRGERFPDALLTFRSPDMTLIGALLDCKAAANGYKLESDHELRFEQYVTAMSPELGERGIDLQFLVVLSSGFPGRSGTRHPFHARNRKMQNDLGVNLAYLKAVDVARAGVALLSNELTPAARESLDWSKTFSAGLVQATDFEQMVREVT